MRKIDRGLATALLCVAITVLNGCGNGEPLYTAGLAVETEACDETAGGSEITASADSDGTTGSIADGTVSAAIDGTLSAGVDGMTGTGEEDTAGSGAGSTVSMDAEGMEAAGADGAVTAAADGTSEEGTVSGTLAGLDTDAGSVQTEPVIGYVYVCGAVVSPGVYPITVDMRVCDAIELAGGFLAEADEEWLNQASAVSDGQKLYVYTTEETDLMKASGMTAEGMGVDSSWSGTSGTVDSTTNGTAGNRTSDDVMIADGSVSPDGGTSESGASTAASDGKVNINTATREELMTLPGIGESKADAILAYRSEHGAFASIEEIQNISGIKSGVFSQIKDLITV